MRSRVPIDLVSEPPRYPLVLAACWIGGCGAVDAATGNALRVELLYLPAVLAPTWLVCALRVQRRVVARLDTMDAATGFTTRPGLLQALADELARTERLGGDTSIACISLDGLPRLVAERMGGTPRKLCDAIGLSVWRIDTVARLADDEFALLLRGTGSSAAAAVAHLHECRSVGPVSAHPPVAAATSERESP